MYAKYWNLRKAPFPSAYNPDELHLFDQFQEGVARFRYLVERERLAGLLIAENGCGKSFLLSNLADRLMREKITVLRFDAIPYGDMEFLRHVLAGFGIKKGFSSVAEGLALLQELCQRADGKLSHSAVLVDEAQYLSDGQGLQIVHGLTNLRFTVREGVQKPLCTVVLAGTPGLEEKIHNSEPLRDRIQLSWHLEPLDYPKTVELVQSRILSVGGDQWVFDEETLKELFKLTLGFPRKIVNVCDAALMLGFSMKVPRITPEIIAQAAIDTGVAVPVSKGTDK